MLQTKNLYLILDNVWKILVTFYIMIHVVAEYRCLILTVPHITMDRDNKKTYHCSLIKSNSSINFCTRIAFPVFILYFSYVLFFCLTYSTNWQCHFPCYILHYEQVKCNLLHVEL